MAARPNALRTLEYGQRLVENQLNRLDEMVQMVDKVLQDNKTLTAKDVAAYKACTTAAKKQIGLFTKITEIPLPVIPEEPARKRGRPSQADLALIASTHGKKSANAANAVKVKAVVAVAAPAVVAAAAPKKRGRKSNATIAAEAAAAEALLAAATPAPKKRGRPAKAKSETKPEAVVTAAVVNQGPPAKRRGRPPKVIREDDEPDASMAAVQPEDDEPVRITRKPKSVTPAFNVIAITEGDPVKRGPGRPKGSKNKPTLMNGQNAEIVSA